MHRLMSFLVLCSLSQLANALPKGFVYLHDLAPTIIEDLRYTTSNNFIGRPITGYKANRCILTLQAAEHLLRVQQAANQQGYSLKVYDCYRPQRAVDTFYQWSLNPKDSLMKASFYPREDKKYLFAKGYIAQSSGHTRGSTIDLSLVKIGSKTHLSKPATNRCYGKTPSYQDDNSIDTGTRFDCMDRSANTDYQALTKAQKNNRLLLRHLMLTNGFMPYEQEWWHFTLRNEPFPKTYFNFVVN
ncbi:D-alanyl-D-alanine dipeptidase [Legionella massiliensis]|uniref:D-alanyl-D-alanine dipeptidase n=1 Tax=Legionella massiliensis TaxID=1034943 RepID=A0A078KRU3_9GAMM|nr:M15 family metallopeptidase [Legionella massiliensis]CDZ75816.1 D-alanyl-D-alanine dipeptidase [Legionella massiliensis]CEE11554.1 D-alanyl-D-alanine dipeptidase [Legionella massiliensis]